MGSNQLISAREAAAILGLSVPSLNRLVLQGLLQPVYSRDKPLSERRYRMDEVDSVAEAREKGKSLPKVASLAIRGYAASRALEHRVEQIEQVLGIDMDPLPLDEDAVLALYAEASDVLHPPKKPEELTRWARVFLSMGEEFLELLEAYTGDEEAWLVFTTFARAILDAAPAEPAPAVKKLYGMMRAARNHLRNVAFLHARNKYGARQANQVFHGDEHDQILKIIAGMG